MSGHQKESHMSELAIRNLVDDYCHHVMTADSQAWAGTWAQQANWSVPGRGLVEGREEIRKVFEEIRSTYAFCVQELLGLRIQVSADLRSASTRCLVRELQWSRRDEGFAGSELIGVYDDEIVSTPEGPRFQMRDFALLYSGPVALDGRFHRAAYERSQFLKRTGE